MKLLSIAVPCYNSEAYMEKCVASLLIGGGDVEILIVDDGSKDRTAQIADALAAEHPDIIRVIHKENGGHGSAVNAGLENAQGVFFKVVDSDDRLSADAYLKALAVLRELHESGTEPDMFLCNYVYDKEGEKHKKEIQYHNVIPHDRIFTWEEVGQFHTGQYILMHSVIFRTQMLRDCGLRLPEHCFYVDNLYVFEPLPYVETMYYLDVDLYMYYIGREDQSVNEKVMISRLDQQMRVNRRMIDYFTDAGNEKLAAAPERLKTYMYHYREILTTVSSVLAIRSGTEEHLKMKDELWDYLKQSDRKLYTKLRRGILGISMNLPGRGGRALTVGAYKIAQKFFKFN